MSDFNSLVQYTVENISRPVKYIIYKLTEFIRVVDKFVFRQVPAGAASGYATIEKVEGNTVKFNQLIKIIENRHSIIGFTFTRLSNTKVRFVGTGNTGGDSYLSNTFTSSAISGHKYLFSTNTTGATTSNITFHIGTKYTTVRNNSKWIQTKGVDNFFLCVNCVAAFTESTTFEIECNSIDLTAIFGAGNEPTTVADFEAWMTQNGLPSVADYNAGELLSVKMESLKSIGFNQWDEEWEDGAVYESGNIVPTPNRKTTSFIPVFPLTTYYQKCPSNAGSGRYAYYDKDKNFLQYNSVGLPANTEFTTPINAYYIRITFGIGYGTTYNHDICINFSDPTKNGTYQPYMTDSANIDVTTITGINTATNMREVIFPNGMKQADYAGTVKDTLDLLSDTATVNVGSRAYQSGDESDTDVLTDRTTTYYALTTPIEYTDLQDANGNPLNPRYKVEQGGTEQVLPANTSTPTTVAPTLTTTYTKDVH